MRILVVEDEEKMANVVKHILGEHGYIVDLAADGFEGQNKLSGVQYDLFIIDVMLPHESGLSFCKQIRESDPSVPILILSPLMQRKIRSVALRQVLMITSPTI